jgi:DNA-binding PucR family transcriptional regulator
MPAPDTLDAFESDEYDPVKFALLTRFREMWKDPEIPADTYSQRLRETLEQYIEENSHAPDTAESP